MNSPCLYQQDQAKYDYYSSQGAMCDCDFCRYAARRIKAKRHVKRRVYDNPLFPKSLKHAGQQFDKLQEAHHVCVFHPEPDGLWHCSCGRQREYL